MKRLRTLHIAGNFLAADSLQFLPVPTFQDVTITQCGVDAYQLASNIALIDENASQAKSCITFHLKHSEYDARGKNVLDVSYSRASIRFAHPALQCNFRSRQYVKLRYDAE